MPDAAAKAQPIARTLTLELAGPGALTLDSGQVLDQVTIAYNTYGELNAQRSNAILLCHALTGDQHAASANPLTGRPGWWDLMVGPGLVFDTNRFFVICSNVVGGCMGTTGPKDINPATGKPYGLTFPVITIRDMVRAQVLLVDHLGINELLCVAGGSMGGMQVLEWMASFPERLVSAMPLATTSASSAPSRAASFSSSSAVVGLPKRL